LEDFKVSPSFYCLHVFDMLISGAISIRLLVD
jgi:hypothetical protein